MIKPILLIAFVTGLLAACSPADKVKEKPGLKYFEISYHSGWAERFSMKADSAGRFIFSHRLDSFYTGILPDFLRDSLYSISTLIKNDSTCMNIGDRCDDCGAVHLKLVTNVDSADRVQLGHFCEAMQKLVNTISEQKKLLTALPKDTLVFFKTEEAVLIPVPPVIEPRRFKKPR